MAAAAGRSTPWTTPKNPAMRVFVLSSDRQAAVVSFVPRDDMELSYGADRVMPTIHEGQVYTFGSRATSIAWTRRRGKSGGPRI